VADSKGLDLRRHLPSVPFVIIVVALVIAVLAVLDYIGVYNIGADVPHSPPVHWVIESLRERSIEVRAQMVTVPRDLGDPQRIAKGAGLYDAMCTSCHLAPGVEKTELAQGLYPPAPELARVVPRPPQQQFWIIKHGVKLTAMPAWGRTHSDDLIWDMVAFVQTLPKTSPEQYQAAVKSAPADHDEMMRNMPR
jgi:mono/diheme cytochrome c family protein